MPTNTPAPPKRGSRDTTRRAKSSAKGAEWTFPQDTLEDAIRVAKAIEDKHAGKPISAPDLAKAVGFNQAQDWRFLRLLRSANLYGLVTGSGVTATVSLEQLGQDIVAPSSPSQRQKALLAAFHKVDHFLKVEEFYRGKRIPEDEFFQNTIVREFGIPRERVQVFQEVFVKNLQFLKTFGGPPPEALAMEPTEGTPSVTVEPPQATLSITGTPESRVREFLDTCFVLMPFGGWFDTYYSDVYSPAIRDAGFEPVRADEVFATGSVVEQIWEQIKRSTVLFAELTGKSANVFYELGLAHAARKPVVLVASNIDDVPFDLRHLRTALYEVKAPNWAAKLQKEITSYLKATRSDPEKAIPHPFRGDTEREEAG